MTQNDITLIGLIVVALLLLGHAGTRYADSVSVEAELTAEWNLLERQAADGCQSQAGCDAASFKLALQTTKSDVYQAYTAANRDKWKAGGHAALTVLGLLLILWLYPQLLSGLRVRFARKGETPGQTTGEGLKT